MAHSKTPATKMIRTREIASTCGVTVATVTKWAASGAMPRPYRFGTGTNALMRWPKEEIDSWLEQCRVRDEQQAG